MAKIFKITKGHWYECINDWSDDGWTKFRKGDICQASHDNRFMDCYGIEKDFSVDGICYFRELKEDELPKFTKIDIDEFVDEYKQSMDFHITSLANMSLVEACLYNYRQAVQDVIDYLRRSDD